MKVGNPFSLTPRQLEALGLVAKGKTNPQIACIMNIEVGSVEGLLTSAYRKLEVENRYAAIRFCLTNAALLGLTDLL